MGSTGTRGVVWVTGGAGFIGSHLTERLRQEDWHVVVVDCLTDYYDPGIKKANMTELLVEDGGIDWRSNVLGVDDLDELPPPEAVFHLAGQPGVRPSWGDEFRAYLDRNIWATSRIADYCLRRDAKLVYASSSSVYGVLPPGRNAVETDPTVPHSPYGVTKLGGELLIRALSANLGLRSASLRYFTVYGPRQRPDMAIHRLCEAARTGSLFPMNGDGSQIREFSYVGDVVEATVRSLQVASAESPVLNVAGGESVSLGRLIGLVEEVSGHPIGLERMGTSVGDVPSTAADASRISRSIDWRPAVSLRDGVSNQYLWHLKRFGRV